MKFLVCPACGPRPATEFVKAYEVSEYHPFDEDGRESEEPEDRIFQHTGRIAHLAEGGCDGSYSTAMLEMRDTA